MVAIAPDIILANTATVVSALRQQTQSIPIVFAQVVDPVSSGFVESLARPGGNVTGFLSLDFGMGAKWLEMLKEIAPRVTRVGVLRERPSRGNRPVRRASAAASSLRVEVRPVDVRDAATIERGVTAFAREPNGGLVVVANPGHVGFIAI